MSTGEMMYGALADAAADAAGVPRDAFRAIISLESSWNPNAFLAEAGPAGSGSYGLCQVTLSTAQGMGYTGAASGLLDPATNLRYGAQVFAGALQNANAAAPNADPLTLLQMAASAYNAGYRPSLGFGAPATVPVTVCLRRDPSSGACVQSFTAQSGQYGNQQYVDTFTHYFTAEGGDPSPLDNSASVGGDASAPASDSSSGAVPSPSSDFLSYFQLDPAVGVGLAALVGVVLLLFLHHPRRSPAT